MCFCPAGGAEERRDVQRPPGQLRQLDEHQPERSDLHLQGEPRAPQRLPRLQRRTLFTVSMTVSMTIVSALLQVDSRLMIDKKSRQPDCACAGLLLCRTEISSGGCRSATYEAAPSSTCASPTRSSTWSRRRWCPRGGAAEACSRTKASRAKVVGAEPAEVRR